ncbi:RNA-directed DNA polymerase, eukaryota [Tanacetum coccineum]
MMNNHNQSFYHSNESQIQKISSSVYVTNFHDSTTSRDLWKACSTYGTVVDVFIPFKKSKAGKKFDFVRFIKVTNLVRLVENLNTVWIGRYHLFANRVRFERPVKPIFEQPQKPSFKPYIAKSAAPSNSFASILKEGHVSVNNSKPAIVLDESCMKVHDFNLSLMGKVKNVSTIPNLPVLIAKEGFQNIKLDYLGGMWVLFVIESKSTYDKFLDHIGVRSWFSTIKQADNSFVIDERIIWVSVKGFPIKAWTPNSFKKIASCWGELVKWEDSGHNSFSCKHLCLKTRIVVIINDKRKLIVQGKAVSESSFMHEMDHVINSVHVDSTHRNVDEDKPGENAPQFEDPFGIYDLLKNNHHQSSCNSESVDPLFSPGFTPRPLDQEKLEEVNPKGIDECVQSLSNKLRASKKHGTPSINSSNSGSFKRKAGGSILELMDELVNVGQTMGYNMDGCIKDIESIIGSKGDFDHFK